MRLSAKITKSLIVPCLKPRRKNSHKGTYGHVFTVAGSMGKIGAGVLSAYAALQAGAGLSTLLLPKGAYQKIDSKTLELMIEPVGKGKEIFFVPQHLKKIQDLLKKASVVILGPGLGTNPRTIRFVHQLISNLKGPMVIDADGLNAIAQNPSVLQKRKGRLTLLTPHPGEMGRLIGRSTSYVQNNRKKVVSEFSKKQGVVTLLKGYHSLLAFPDGQVWVNPTGNPAMASAGQGDVLSGIYGGLLAQYPNQTAPLYFGCFLHGLVGDILAKNKRVVLASDIANNLHLGYQFL